MSEKEENGVEFTESPTQRVEVTHIVKKEGEKGKKGKKGNEGDPEKTEEELKEELEEKQAMLEMVGEKIFIEQRAEVCKVLNLDPETIKDPKELVAYAKIVAKQKALKKFGKKEPPASGVGLGGNLQDDSHYIDPTMRPSLREYESHEEMITDLEQTAKEGLTPEIRREAQQALAQLFKKSLKDLDRGGYVEFEGEITKAMRTKARETPEEKAKRKHEASKWKRKR